MENLPSVFRHMSTGRDPQNWFGSLKMENGKWYYHMLTKHISPKSIDIYNYINITSLYEIKNLLYVFNIKKQSLRKLKI